VRIIDVKPRPLRYANGRSAIPLRCFLTLALGVAACRADTRPWQIIGDDNPLADAVLVADSAGAQVGTALSLKCRVDSLSRPQWTVAILSERAVTTTQPRFRWANGLYTESWPASPYSPTLAPPQALQVRTTNDQLLRLLRPNTFGSTFTLSVTYELASGTVVRARFSSPKAATAEALRRVARDCGR
jgi:hypothetical protein